MNWSTMLNNSPLYQKQDMVIRDEDYCRKNGLMGLSDKQLRAYPNAGAAGPATTAATTATTAMCRCGTAWPAP